MDNSNENLQPKESIGDAIKKFKAIKENDNVAMGQEIPKMQTQIIPKTSFNAQNFEDAMSKETDPDLMMSYEIVKLPSGGLFYENGISEVAVEYMTSKDEDLLTTPSLIENGTVLEVLLKRKIKTQGVVVENLLAGDRNAILLFLRTSSYGSDYTVTVSDPRTGIPFNSKVDLTKLEYKIVEEMPDERGYYNVFIPMRKKTVVVRLISSGEDTKIFKKAESIKEAYNEEYSQYSTLRLKSSIVSINGNTDRSYIDRFVDVMPALDAFTIRKKIMSVSPDVNMSYEFMTNDGYKFYANLSVGIDFFFPST